MRIDEVLQLLKKAPFEPFGIYMSDGSAYPVTHPDQVIVTPRSVYVGIAGNGRQPVAERVVICDMMHITRLGPVPRRRAKRRTSS